MTKTPILDIKITSSRLISACLLAFTVFFGLWWMSNNQEGFETLCTALGLNVNEDGSVESSQALSNDISLEEEQTDEEKQILTNEQKQQLNTIVNAAVSTPLYGEPTDEEGTDNNEEGQSYMLSSINEVQPCDLLEKPMELDTNTRDIADALERNIIEQVLPSTSMERNKLVNSVQNELTNNENIPDSIKNNINSEDAKSVILIIAIEQQVNAGELSLEDAEKARKMLEAKSYEVSPKRSILQQLAKKLMMNKLNRIMTDNQARKLDPNTITSVNEVYDSYNSENRFGTQNYSSIYTQHTNLFNPNNKIV